MLFGYFFLEKMPHINLNFTSTSISTTTTDICMNSDECECCGTHDNGCCLVFQVPLILLFICILIGIGVMRYQYTNETNTNVSANIFHIKKTYDISKFIKIKINDENNENNCIICLDNFSNGNEYYELNCGHIFHPNCIRKWYSANGNCPICRGSNNNVPDLDETNNNLEDINRISNLQTTEV